MKTLIFSFLMIFNLNLLVADSWIKTNGPYGGSAYNTFIISNANIFVYTYKGKIYQSSDFGKSWVFTPFDTVTSKFSDMYFSTFTEYKGNIYTTGGTSVYCFSAEKKQWLSYNLDFALLERNYRKRIFFSNNKLFCVVDSLGIYELNESNSSWSFFAKTNTPIIDYIRNFAVTKSGNLLISDYYGVYSSNDKGNNWIQNFQKNAILFTTRESIYIQEQNLLKLNEIKDQWDTVIFQKDYPKSPCYFFPVDSNHIVSYNPLFLSLSYTNDSGKKWINAYSSNSCIESGSFNTIVSVFIKDSCIIFNDNGTIYRHNLRTKMTDFIEMKFVKYSIDLIYPFKDKKVFVANGYGLYSTEDNGKTYKLCFPQCTTGNWYNKLVSRGDLIAGTSRMNFFYSTDAGKTWTINFTFYDDFDIDSDGTIYVSDQGNDFHKTTDFGKTWTSCSGNLPDYGGTKRPYVVAFCLNGNGNIIASNITSSVYITKDDGKTWKSAITPKYQITQFIKTSKYIFGITDFNNTSDISQYIIRSSDGGETWEELQNNLSAGAYKFFKGPNDELIASDLMETNKGLFVSFDEGKTWKTVSTSFDSKIIPALAFQPNGAMWCGTDSGSVYYSPVSTLSAETEFSYNNDCVISPNPATDFIEITFHSVKLNPIQHPGIKIYNVFGEEISTTPPFGHPFEIEGEFLKIDVSGLTAGIYFIRVGDRVGKFVKY